MSGLVVPTGRVRVRVVPKKPKPHMRQHPGRKVGSVAGAWIDDNVALQNSIMLCDACKHKFDAKAHNYWAQTRFPTVWSKCDGCRKWSGQCAWFIHEALLGRNAGHVMDPSY